MGLFNFFKKKPSTLNNSGTPDASDKKVNVAEVTTQLEQLGFFQYVAPENLEHVKLEMGYEIAVGKHLAFLESDVKPYLPLDLRHYGFDNEFIFEEGGMTGMLQEMKTFFDKLQVVFEVTGHIEECNEVEGSVYHEMCINGKRYILFDHFKGYGWGEAAQRFTDMVNDQLSLQGSPEPLYLVCGGNDGRAVFLTAEQAEFLAALIPSMYERPLDTKKWCEIMEVEWINVCS